MNKITDFENKPNLKCDFSKGGKVKPNPLFSCAFQISKPSIHSLFLDDKSTS
ncbi:hypothetical protein LPC_1453 [Legionella pneumophila str. Corby]|nr:hypothetical protein LPC_1453 [Legionella pneumophila str. Corby]